MAAVDVQEVLLRMRIELSKRGTACMLFVKEALHDRDPTGEGYLSYAVSQSLTREHSSVVHANTSAP